MKKILVYSHATYRLGNIRRILEIISHLVHSDPDVHVLLISGSPMLQAFRIPPRVDYIKLPCIGRSEKGETVVKSLGISPEDTIRMRANIIMTAALDFDPDVVLVDKKPFGLQDELKLALAKLRRCDKQPKTALLLPDILDAPEATIQVWNKGGYHDAIRAFYDRVLVLGSEGVFHLAREYRFPKGTADKVRYCGYIKGPAPARSSREVRAALGFGEEPFVLVTTGGGRNGYAMMKTYLQGLVRRTGRQAFRSLLVSGPEMSPDEHEEIFRLAAGCEGVTVKVFTDDMMSCMNAADLVVSMGGYNTVCELLALKKNTIVVPRVRPGEQQWIRAERMQAMGLLRTIHPDRLTPEGLIEAVEAELAGDRGHAPCDLEMEGLPRIAGAIGELMREESLAPARRMRTPRFSFSRFGTALRPSSLAGSE